MSERYPSFSPTWHQCNARVQNIVDKHWDRLKKINFVLLLPYIKTKLLLTEDEETTLCQHHWAQHQQIKQLLAFVRQKKGSQWYGFDSFTECLRESGEKGPHPGHRELAALLHRDLHGKLWIQWHS